MSKIIVIGECGLDVIYDGVQPIGSMPSGCLLNAAMMLSRRGLPVTMAGDMGADALGDIIERYLEDAGVDTASIDRYTEGKTSATFFVGDQVITYSERPEEGFDIVWPRVDPGDVIVYGGYYAIDPSNHRRVSNFIANAIERKAFVVYLPGYISRQVSRITRVMPAILENLETASMIIARSADLDLIYGDSDSKRCFEEHVAYYTPLMVAIDAESGSISAYHRDGCFLVDVPYLSDTLLGHSAAISAVIETIYSHLIVDVENCGKQAVVSLVNEARVNMPTGFGDIYPDWQLKH